MKKRMKLALRMARTCVMTWAGLAALLGQAEEYTNDTDWTGADWVLADGDTIGGVHTNVGLFSVPEGVTVSVMTYQSDVPGSGAAAVFADRIRIKGVLSANGAGYPMAEGPGTGGPGAGHGGLGGGSPNATGGGRYGSVREPVTLGSGGSKGGAHAGGAGGGAIRLVASDILEIDGTLSANGIDSPQTKGSGGSGGSLWLSAPTLGGSGLICADGGGCYPVGGAGAGGGGGRIAFAVETNLFLGIVRASGGKSYHERAGHGTLNVMDLYGPDDDLVVTGDIALPPSTNWAFRGLIVSNNATLEVQSFPGTVSRLTVLQDVLIAEGAGLSGDGQGFPQGQGPGTGIARGGASYGGLGADAEGGHGGPLYGSVSSPDALGSGGGGDPDTAGRGGGAVLVQAGETMILDGVVSANGWSTYSFYGGGGSGGSVWLCAPRIAGDGLVMADGGTAYRPGSGNSGGGGGGRIAFETEQCDFSGTVRASGGLGRYERAGHGTFNFQDCLASNDALMVPGDIALSPSNGWTFASLTVLAGAVLDIQSSPDTVSRLVVRGDVTIEPGAGISADGMGFEAKNGPGGASGNSGGSYGGLGGGVNAGPVYGNTNAPIDLGSGGGTTTANANPRGGGVVILEAEGDLVVEGVVSADTWTQYYFASGAGSGGSLWLIGRELRGSGELRADGGDASAGGGASGGGGGRIAVWTGAPIPAKVRAALVAGESPASVTISESPPLIFTGNTWVRGGTAANPGQDGTVVFVQYTAPPLGTLLQIR